MKDEQFNCFWVLHKKNTCWKHNSKLQALNRQLTTKLNNHDKFEQERKKYKDVEAKNILVGPLQVPKSKMRVAAS